jgi:hypothetical protein
MQSNELTLGFTPITEEDVADLTAVMVRAFDESAKKHRGVNRDGPEGYDNGEFFRKWLFGARESVGFKLETEGRIIGGVIVWIFPHGHNVLGTIFVDPGYQDRGVATRTWRFIESAYPNAKSWMLETPVWATKNHFFYETKCGFRNVETRGDFIVYMKEVVPSS